MYFYVTLKSLTRKGSITCCNVGTTLKVLSPPRYPSTLICSSTAPPFLPFTQCLPYLLLSITCFLVLQGLSGLEGYSVINRHQTCHLSPSFCSRKTLEEKKLHCHPPFFSNLSKLRQSDLLRVSSVAFIFRLQNIGNGRIVLSQSRLSSFLLILLPVGFLLQFAAP